MKIEFIPLELTDDYENNSNTHPVEQIHQIKALMLYLGVTNIPLVRKVDKRYGIIAGHGRREAIVEIYNEGKSLNMADGTPIPVGTMPVVFADGWTDEQVAAYVMADNVVPKNSIFDAAVAARELEKLQAVEFDLSLIGFGDDELDRLLSSLDTEELNEGLTDPDDVPEPPVDPITKQGDIWLLGRHRVMCGDSTSFDAVEKLMDGGAWDVCVFDPPYDAEDLYVTAMPVAQRGKKLAIMWDFKRFAIAPVSAVNAGWEPQYEFIWDCVQSWFTPNRPLQRHKSIGIFGDNPFFNTETSIINDGKDRGSARTVRNTRGESDYHPLDGAKHIATVEAFPNTRQADSHGHGKPVAWIEAIFNGIGGNIYFDAFGGSGATLIACEKTNKQCFTMEIEPSYCDVIVKRWQDFTGKEAVLLSSGELFNELLELNKSAS